jgi:hypothetical protein
MRKVVTLEVQETIQKGSGGVVTRKFGDVTYTRLFDLDAFNRGEKAPLTRGEAVEVDIDGVSEPAIISRRFIRAICEVATNPDGSMMLDGFGREIIQEIITILP